MKITRIAFLLLCVGWVFLWPEPAHAQQMMSSIATQFHAAAQSWANSITTAATWLFWTLATISFVWTFGMMMLRRVELGEVFAELLKFMVFTGFFFWLLQNGSTYAGNIISSMQQLANNAGGNNQNYSNPSGIAQIAMNIGNQYMNSVGALGAISNLPKAIFIVLTALSIVIILGLVAVNLLIMICTAWLLAYAGIFFLGFGGCRWISDIAIGYYKTVLNIGIQILAQALIVSCGSQFMTNLQSQTFSGGLTYSQCIETLFASVLLFFLVDKLPPIMAGIAVGINHAGQVGNTFSGSSMAVGAAMQGLSAATGGLSNVVKELSDSLRDRKNSTPPENKGQTQETNNRDVLRSAFGDSANSAEQ